MPEREAIHATVKLRRRLGEETGEHVALTDEDCLNQLYKKAMLSRNRELERLAEHLAKELHFVS